MFDGEATAMPMPVSRTAGLRQRALHTDGEKRRRHHT
jgi:hypothetical protein